jgi:sarcosine oxidase subunit gamma
MQKGGACVVKLIAQSPCGDELPLAIGGLNLTEVAIDRMWSVAPFKGKSKAVSDALGATLPKPNRSVAHAGMRMIWAGQGVSFVIADALPDLVGLAAVTDQSDAWAVVEIKGPGVAEVLARLVPIDLRLPAFKPGHTARTMLAHMMASITRTGKDSFEIMVMRSMAQTLVHDLNRAATLFSGRM